jgi:hypothetical protein
MMASRNGSGVSEAIKSMLMVLFSVLAGILTVSVVLFILATFAVIFCKMFLFVWYFIL